MAYSESSRKPSEYASKSNHSFIINDEDVQKFLGDCRLPLDCDEINDDIDHLITTIEDIPERTSKV